MKRLALFLDGTWNDPEDNTNVSRLKVLTADRDGVPQLVFYGEGVGNRASERLRGGALGKGLSRNVRTGYQWLIEHYEDGDQVFLFGFSRGAFTARTLAGMIARCGLLQPGAAMSVPQAYARYRQGKEATPLHELEWRQRDGEALSPDERLWLESSRRIDIEFIGVWDTVGALGVPFGKIRGLSRSTFEFHNTYPSVLYKNMFHAVAIDEHRKAFDATLWTGFQPKGEDFDPLKPDQTIEQRWFVGDHCDVGGGHPSAPLAQIPLAWLQTEAAARGLAFKRMVEVPDEAMLARPHDSFASFALGVYRLIKLNQRHLRTIGRPPRRTARKPGLSHVLHETIDASVFAKWRDDPTYRPSNLADWAAERGLNPAAFHETMEARTGTMAAKETFGSD